MITRERMAQEIAVFDYMKMPRQAYRFLDMDTDSPYIVLAARTNNGNLYTVRIDLDEFPNEIPEVYVHRHGRVLRDSDGEALDSCSASMHTLEGNHGYTQICHFSYVAWRPTISLFKVYVRCRLWLEAYEGHLKTGLPLDHWLKHAE